MQLSMSSLFVNVFIKFFLGFLRKAVGKHTDNHESDSAGNIRENEGANKEKRLSILREPGGTLLV